MLTAAIASAAFAGPAVESNETIYEVQQSVSLSDIPKNAKNVGLWISIPDDRSAQRVLDFSVTSAPGAWKIVRDRDRACRFLYVEVLRPGAETLTTTVAFSVQRAAVAQQLDPATARALSVEQKAVFAEELRLDSPHMQVTDKTRKMLRDICGDETKPVVISQKLLHYVADIADHYSKNPNVPSCGIGDAGACVTQGGGCCTDLHSLFISLARAGGIPARLQMGYRLQPKNAGTEVDPGYRCWVEYFIAGSGWVSADIVEGDAGDDSTRARWFTGLTERRVHLNEGREFDLPGRKNAARVNHMSIAYAEIDGKPARILPDGEKKPQITRTVRFTERAAAQPTPHAAQ